MSNVQETPRVVHGFAWVDLHAKAPRSKRVLDATHKHVNVTTRTTQAPRKHRVGALSRCHSGHRDARVGPGRTPTNNMQQMTLEYETWKLGDWIRVQGHAHVQVPAAAHQRGLNFMKFVRWFFVCTAVVFCSKSSLKVARDPRSKSVS